MEKETINTVLDLVVQYSHEKHYRVKGDILQKIEDILTLDKQTKKGKTKKYGKSETTNPTDREEGTQACSATEQGTDGDRCAEGREQGA